MTTATAVRERGITFGAPMVQALRREVDPKGQTRRIVKPQPEPYGVSSYGGTRVGYCWKPESLNRSWNDDDADPYKAPSASMATAALACECPYGKPGDRLYVREAWYVGKCADGFKPSELDPGTWKRDNGGLWYPADDTEPSTPISPKGRYRNARFMPRWASRITLEITEVRVQRLQEISEDDALAEGCEPWALTDADIADIQISDENPQMKQFAKALGPGSCSARAEFQMLWDSIHGTEHSWASNPWVWCISFRRLER